MIRTFATANYTRLEELRRGVDYAVIFSLAFSPSSTLLAVTSDKSTLHVFDVPRPQNKAHRSQSPASATEEAANQKWGLLGRVPLLSRIFSDVYSFASAHFEMGDEIAQVSGSPQPVSSSLGRAPKGIIGWSDDQTILVIGAGREGRWEKFVLRDGGDGRRYCIRDGWKRYLGS